VLDQIIDAADARVVVRRDGAGQVAEAHFDLSGLPRVDALMVGRPVAEVPGLAQRLCGICPVAHHLAGVQALETLWGPVELTPTVQLVRRLLNYGSVIDAHVLGFVAHDLPAVMALRRLAKLAMAAAGSPRHFPTTAVVGGIASVVQPGDVASAIEQLPDALEAARRLVSSTGQASRQDFSGADVALVDDDGRIDLLGRLVRAVAADGTVIIDGETADRWSQIVTEARPGDPAPRPYLTSLGPTAGVYRTGPVAQLRVGQLGTPEAAEAQQRWLAAGGDAAEARAIIVLHCVEAIGQACQAPELLLDDIGSPLTPMPRAGEGTGWAETGRGLLVHRYASGVDGTVTSATILTPTAQNEPWLAALLTSAIDEAAMEDAIREADPCLPCATALPGQMGLVVTTQTVE